MTLQSLPSTLPVNVIASPGVPALPRFSIALTTAQATSKYTAGAWGMVNWDTAPVAANLGASPPTIWTAGDPNKLILPGAGWWLVTLSGFIATVSAPSNFRSLVLNKNSAGNNATNTLAQKQIFIAGAASFVDGITWFVQANGTTDYVEVFGYAQGATWGFGSSGLTALQAMLLST